MRLTFHVERGISWGGFKPPSGSTWNSSQDANGDPTMAKRANAKGRRRLGRGLTSLVSDPVRLDLASEEAQVADAAPAPESSGHVASPSHEGADEPTEGGERGQDAAQQVSPAIQMLDPATIQPNRHQPRQSFDESALAALADSIRTAGMMQPIVVRPGVGPRGGEVGRSFELIAGERRWRAAQRLGLTRIPAVIRDVDEETAAEWSLIENIQREDLNAIERAEAFERLASSFGLTHAQVAEKVGLERSTVSNHLRLLELDGRTQEAVRQGALAMGHARALLAITNTVARAAMAKKALAGGWSVRELERRARRAVEGAETPGFAASKAPVDGGDAIAAAHLRDLEERLGEHLGTKVAIKQGRKRGAGTLSISFYDLDQFQGLLEQMQFAAE